MSVEVLWTGFGPADICTFSYDDVAADRELWASPLVEPGFRFDELVASWNVATPAGTWVEVVAQVVSDDEESGWLALARWSSDPGFSSGTVGRQSDPVAVVDDDTIRAREGRTFTGYRLGLTLCRAAGVGERPEVSLIGAMVSAGARGAEPASYEVPRAVYVEGVPTYSQQLHRDRYPEWDGGGQSWCSAASTAMVLDFWGVGPTAEETEWVAYETPDPQVPYTAREVFDHGAQGTGTWPFNTAYAATRGLSAYVTRLRSLAEAAGYLRDRIPLVLSIAHTEGELTGAGYVTDGHLVVLVGIDADGNPIVHDPASHGEPDDAQVRTTYDRAELERAWGRSGRIAYVMTRR